MERGSYRIRMGPIAVRRCGLLFALGFVIGLELMQRIYEREGKPVGDLSVLMVYVMIGTVLSVLFSHGKRRVLEAEQQRAWLASFPELNPEPVAEISDAGDVKYLNPAIKTLLPDLERMGSSHPFFSRSKCSRIGTQSRGSERQHFQSPIFFAELLVARFSGKGLVPDAFTKAPEFLLAVALGAGATVIVAFLSSFPISTTHGLTGALVGTGLVAVGSQMNFSVLAGAFLLPLGA